MKVTREDVKQQLAKNPLEWKKRAGLGFNAYFSLQFRISSCHAYYRALVYKSKDRASSIAFIGLDDDNHYLVEETLDYSSKSTSEEEELNQIAEEHRLNLVCSLLGIKE